ncbi:serine/threonine-protein kinase [Flavobacterium pectinovorum]|uniref:serine/threonine-protein kinase n=1 Tax=Flavobacterium pectinovorum TaxID=29533 RepID=UPI00265F5C7D|nr:serine/threonine-protein kinase [Flavobacterium pectinovorum]WKL46868.1 serine/threonine-protein kinase [Flavobacterium pectinovorum]
MIAECTSIKELAQGGQKKVYLADHHKFGKVVIKKGLIKSFTSLERIKREVKLLDELDSEYYPKQYHFNIDFKTNEFEIVEEYIDGSILRDNFGFFNNDPTKIFSLLDSLIDGLSLIWEKNVVHRDLKPENIILRPNMKPCIIDLGIARFLDLEALTKTIAPIGPCTPIYASSEQLTNNKNSIDVRTDFFALAVIALELYLGQHPYNESGSKYSIVENILRNNYIVENSNVKQSEQMSELASKVLHTQPYMRFRNYSLFKEFLKKYL